MAAHMIGEPFSSSRFPRAAKAGYEIEATT
jgi:hypothetical protein